MKDELKLYVWENCLCDYTCGMAFAVASNVEEARELVHAKALKQEGYESGEYEINHYEPDVYDINNKQAFYVFGGG